MEQNIILLGPKAVGKSLISENLQEALRKNGLGNYEVLSLDLFFKFCRQAYNKELFSDRSVYSLNSEIAQLDPNDAKFETYKQMLISDREKELQFITDWTHDYYFPDFADLMETYENVAEVQRYYKYFSNESFMVFDQTVYLLVLERILAKAKKPLIIDAGGNIGCIHDMTNDDLRNVESRFPGVNIKKLQKQLLERIPIRVFIKPCEEYLQIPCADIHDMANQMYMRNPESYKRFANVTVQPKLLFGKILEKYERSNPTQKVVASTLVDTKQVDKTSAEIVEQIKNLKTYE